MQASGIPTKFPIPWAYGAGGAYIRAIPKASQIGQQLGAASLTDGLPPACFSPIAAGGSWPFGQDLNGILKQITQWSQWQQAGGSIAYDAAFSAAIGGYPLGAVVASATTFGLRWLCTVDNNTINPDAGGVGWIAISLLGGAEFFSASSSFAAVTVWHDIQVWGGGGGGGGVDGATESWGGSGGGYSRGRFALVPGTVYPLTIGAGGLGGNGTPTNGTPGGTTSFGSLISATGGGVGFSSSYPGGALSRCGVGQGGQLNMQGQSGAGGLIYSSGVGAGGQGGGAFQSPGATVGSVNGTGAIGYFPGAGGGGTANTSGGGQAGGAGAAGLCIVKWAA